MLINRMTIGITVLCAANAYLAHPQSAFQSNVVPLTASLAVSQTTQVPGKILRPGAYTIRVVDHLSDRVVLQVEDAKGQRLSTFLGLDASGLRRPGSGSGPLLWANGPQNTNTLRGYSFPGGSTVEFVYPKDDAVAIAKVNAAKVAAIDPASEGRVAASHLSSEDLQMVTLWTLSSTRVGPEGDSQPAIAAERYHAPTPTATVMQTTSSVASNNQTSAAKTRTYAQTSHPPVLSASAKPAGASGLTALPHTASDLPLVTLASLLLILVGLVLRIIRPLVHG